MVKSGTLGTGISVRDRQNNKHGTIIVIILISMISDIESQLQVPNSPAEVNSVLSNHSLSSMIIISILVHQMIQLLVYNM